MRMATRSSLSTLVMWLVLLPSRGKVFLHTPYLCVVEQWQMWHEQRLEKRLSPKTCCAVIPENFLHYVNKPSWPAACWGQRPLLFSSLQQSILKNRIHELSSSWEDMCKGSPAYPCNAQNCDLENGCLNYWVLEQLVNLVNWLRYLGSHMKKKILTCICKDILGL